MNKLFGLLFLGLMVGQSGAFAYDKVAQKVLFNGEKLFEYKLSNGLTVLHLPRHSAKVLTYQTWFDVGSLDEKLDPKLNKTGLAHLFEHMMFRGSEKYPDGRFEDLTARMGADRQNASTYFFRTNYYQSVPSAQLESIMELESDRMTHLKLNTELFEKEKGAVVGEFRRHMDSPSGIAFDELHRLAFEVAPHRFTVLGSEEEIKGFTLEEAQYFYKTFYAPNNAVLIVVGDVEEAPLMKLVTKYYGELSSQTIPKSTVPVEPPQKKERRKEMAHPQATSDQLLIGYRIPGINSPEAAAYSLLGSHLSSGMEARLRRLLVDTGIAVRANAFSGNNPDMFEFFVQLTEKHSADEAIKVIDREIASIQRRPISKLAFERALNQDLLSVYSEITDNSSVANFLGEYLMLSGNYLRGFDIMESYKKVTPQDISTFAKKFLVNTNRSIVIVRPEKKVKS